MSGNGRDRDLAANAVGARELRGRVVGSPLEQCHARRQLRIGIGVPSARSGAKTFSPFRGGQLAGVLERDPEHLLGGLVEEDDLPLGVEHGDREGEIRRHLPCPDEREALLPSRARCHDAVSEGSEVRDTRRTLLLTWLTNCQSNAVSADPLAVANKLRPVLLQLARELRREVHPLGVTGGQVSLLVAIRRTPGSRRAGARGERRSVSGGDVEAHRRLVRAGLVRRTAGAGGDGRRVGLELTEEAERVLRLVRSRRTAWLVARLRTLDDEALRSIDDAVEPLRTLIEARP